MKLRYILTLNFLILGLAVVFILKNRLQSGEVQNIIGQIFGLKDDPSLAKISSHSPESWSWCDTRVESIEMGDHRLYQKGQQWLVTKAQEALQVNAVEVEKWLAKYCQIEIVPIPLEGQDLNNYSPLILVRFIDGTQKEFLGTPEGVFLAENRTFSSDEWQQALQDLEFILK
ncbi:MAG: hypothetical protein KDD35_02680 [Bdellovibrionales bacterium]|nr:hypothetical protein [Bdellovibrionales bacterium]